MKTLHFVLPVVCVSVLALALPVIGQRDELAPPVTPTTGVLVFNFTITASSVVPANGIVGCHAMVNVNESTSGQNIQQDTHGIATLSNGSWLCKAKMPYSWMLSTPTSDKVNLSYSVEIDYGYQVTATNGTGTVVVPLNVDKVNQNLASISVPLNGATTTENISARI